MKIAGHLKKVDRRGEAINGTFSVLDHHARKEALHCQEGKEVWENDHSKRAKRMGT